MEACCSQVRSPWAAFSLRNRRPHRRQVEGITGTQSTQFIPHTPPEARLCRRLREIRGRSRRAAAGVQALHNGGVAQPARIGRSTTGGGRSMHRPPTSQVRLRIEHMQAAPSPRCTPLPPRPPRSRAPRKFTATRRPRRPGSRPCAHSRTRWASRPDTPVTAPTSTGHSRRSGACRTARPTSGRSSPAGRHAATNNLSSMLRYTSLLPHRAANRGHQRPDSIATSPRTTIGGVVRPIVRPLSNPQDLTDKIIVR